MIKRPKGRFFHTHPAPGSSTPTRPATDSRNVFEKVFGEIKYLCRAATAGSQEARKLEKVKKAFEDAYRAETKNTVTEDGVRYAIQEKTLTADSTEQERYELLKDERINVAQVDTEKLDQIDLDAYNTRKKSAVFPGLRELASRLGILNVDLNNSRIAFPFQFSTRNLNKSLHHQLEYGGTYQDYAKVMTCFNEIVENAIPIEVHPEKKVGTAKENPDLKNVYVLVSAFQDGNNVVPVELEVKEFRERGKSLYMTVMLTKIDLEVVDAGVPSETGDVPHLFSRSTISLQQLFENVNPKDGRFLKYVPDGFLNDEQRQAKQEALRKQEMEYANYSLSSGETTQYGDYNVYGEDIAIGPVNEAISRNAAYKNNPTPEQTDDDSYLKVLDQLNAEIAMEEEFRRYDESVAEEKRKHNERIALEWLELERELAQVGEAIEKANRAAELRSQNVSGLGVKQARAAAKKTQKSVANSGGNGTIEAERNMANGLRRSYFVELTPEDKEFILQEVDAIGADRNVFRFRDGQPTSYSDTRDIINISSSVFPSDDGSTHPADLLSVRATLAHEYYGHRAHRGTKLSFGAWNDEFRASYTAARDCPGLTDEDRTMLIADAMQRAKDAGVNIKLNSFMRRLLYGYE